jgi:hypothetical protein
LLIVSALNSSAFNPKAFSHRAFENAHARNHLLLGGETNAIMPFPAYAKRLTFATYTGVQQVLRIEGTQKAASAVENTRSFTKHGQ